MKTQAQADSDGTNGTINLTRRQAMQTAAATTGAATVGIGADRAGLSLVDESEAVVPLVGAAAIGAAGLGGAFLGGYIGDKYLNLTEEDQVDADLVKEQYIQKLADALTKRRNRNKSEIMHIKDLAEYSADTVYTEAKVAALTPLQQGKTQQDVKDTMVNKIEEHISVLQENLITAWNTTIAELEKHHSQLNGGIAADFSLNEDDVFSAYAEDGLQNNLDQFYEDGTASYTLYNGSTIDVSKIWVKAGTWAGYTYSPKSGSSGSATVGGIAVNVGNANFDMIMPDEWKTAWDQVVQVGDNLVSDATMWVDNIYGNLQAGEIEIDDLITPAMMDQMVGDEVQNGRAVADLIALNIPTGYEHKAAIEANGAVAEGLLSSTDPSKNVMEGDQIDPTAENNSYFITYDLSSYRAAWQDYVQDIDGGIITFTSDPKAFADGRDATGYVEFAVKTNADETAVVTPSDFSKNNNGNYEADISDQLADNIAQIEEVTVYTTAEETQYVTTRISDTFTVKEIEGTDELTFDQPRKMQKNDNYITPEEFEEQLKRQQEFWDRFAEDLKNDGIAGGGFPTLPGFGVAETIIAVVLGFAGLNLLTS